MALGPAPGTIFALSSGRPPAAIAVIRISGSLAHAAAASLCGSLPEPRQAAVRELRSPASGELLDEALVLRFDGPHSATGEDLVELHCHGGRAVVQAVEAALADLDGLRLAQPGEFTRRAFENGRIDLTEAEGLADLLEAETEAQRRAALAMAEGGLRRQIEHWQDRLIGLSAEAERAIDYAEEDENPAESTALRKACAGLAHELDEWLSRPLAERLRDGVRVVIAGPPNAGKSSLFNALTGMDKAIVTPIEGTTRDVLEAPVAIAGLPFVLVDTAGLRETRDLVEAEGVERARAQTEQADIILWLGPPSECVPDDRHILIHAKADLAGFDTGGLRTSARTGEGISDVLGELVRRASMALPGPDSLALNRRQWTCLAEARSCLAEVADAPDDAVIADRIRAARAALDCLTGRTGIDDLLEALFNRFCLGK